MYAPKYLHDHGSYKFIYIPCSMYCRLACISSHLASFVPPTVSRLEIHPELHILYYLFQ